MQKMAQIITPKTLSRTITTPTSTHRDSEVDDGILENCLAVLNRIRARYLQKCSNWPESGQLAVEWGRVVREKRSLGQPIDELTLSRALLNWNSDWPPLIYDLLKLPTISHFDVQKAVQNIAAAAAKNELCALNRNELYAYQNYPGGSFCLRNESTQKVTKNVEELLAESLKVAVLPELTPANQARLGVKSDPAKVINLSCFLKSIKN